MKFDDLLALLSLFESSLVACVCTFQKLPGYQALINFEDYCLVSSFN